MKHVISTFSIVCIWISSLYIPTVNADTFSPTLLTLDVEPSVGYAFDGSPLEIPVRVSGVDAKAMFCVFTHGQQDAIGAVNNGHLGWHYVNHIDTCVYHCGWPFELQKGDNVHVWDGADQDGNPVPPGDYTYYFWAYDNETPRQLCCYHAFPHSSDFTVIAEGGNGLPLANPLYYTRESIYREGIDFYGGRGDHLQRWAIGGDPKDETLVEACLPVLPEGFSWEGSTAVHPSDANRFYIKAYDTTNGVSTIVSYDWMPEGSAELNTGFGRDGMTELTQAAVLNAKELYIAPLFYKPSDYTGVSAGSEYLFTANSERANDTVTSRFYIYDYRGDPVNSIDLGEWWHAPYEDEFEGGSITSINVKNDKVFLSSHNYCLKQMLDPVAYLESGNTGDLYVWANGNGDYYVDKNFQDTSESPWVCYGFTEPSSEYSISADTQLFSICQSYDNNSLFCLLAPDGTAMNYHRFYLDDSSLQNFTGCFMLDSGTAYDGIYTGLEKQTTQHKTHRIEKGTYFVAQDCTKGMIVPDDTGVNDHVSPVPFELHQNTPNPFNPSTSIRFTLAEPSPVELTVFDITGRKVATLIDNAPLAAGTHEAVFDGAGLASGVYVYRCRAGDMVRCGRMTLVK